MHTPIPPEMFGNMNTVFSGFSVGQTPPAPQMQQLFSSGNCNSYHNIVIPVPEQLELDSLSETLRLLNSEVSNDSCSGSSCYGSPTSLASYGSTTTLPPATPTVHTRPSCLMQRSISSHSLQKNGVSGVHDPFSKFFSELIDSETGPVRRVYSTGDLHRMKMMQRSHRSESPLSSESNMIIEGMSRVFPYSPEEKKERIEKYRSKRSQRNFNKKIKYACRKTLADSRPRIKGRFAKNDELEQKNPVAEWKHVGGEHEEEDEDDWINLLDTFSANIVQ